MIMIHFMPFLHTFIQLYKYHEKKDRGIEAHTKFIDQQVIVLIW